MDGHVLADREESRQLAHGVWRRAEADMAFGGGVAGAVRNGPRIPSVGGGATGRDQPPVACSTERPGVGRQFLVTCGPVGGGQASGFAHEQGGAPFISIARSPAPRECAAFRSRGLWPGPEPASFGRGFAPGEGDLRAGPGPELFRGHPGVGLFAALEQVEGDGEAGLVGGRGGFQVFQVPDLVNSARHCPSPGGRDRQRAL